MVPVNVANCFQQTMLIGFEGLLSIKDVLSCCMLIVKNTYMLLFHRNLLLRTIKYVRKRIVYSSLRLSKLQQPYLNPSKQ